MLPTFLKFHFPFYTVTMAKESVRMGRCVCVLGPDVKEDNYNFTLEKEKDLEEEKEEEREKENEEDCEERAEGEEQDSITY